MRGECDVIQGVSAKFEFWGKFVWVNCVCQKGNTGKLNTNGQQEREHKAHPK